jgi:hypothetical protein
MKRKMIRTEREGYYRLRPRVEAGPRRRELLLILNMSLNDSHDIEGNTYKDLSLSFIFQKLGFTLPLPS